jgi:hypothetical protein
MSNTKQQHDQHSGVAFSGTVGAQRRLTSAGLVVHKLSMYRGRIGRVWEAETDKGPRWISYDDRTGWKISKVAP